MANDLLPKDVPLQHIHTLKSDAAEALSKDNVTQASLLAEKIKEREKQVPKETPAVHSDVVVPRSHAIRNLLLTLFAAVVIAGAGYGILKYAKQRSEEAPIPISTQQQINESLIPYDAKISLSITDADLADKNNLEAKIAQDAVPQGEGVTFYQTESSIRQILSVLSPSIPEEYTRSLSDKDFFGGMPSGNFFILTTDSYEQAYAGQLSWENSMSSDLFPLFSIASSTVSKFEDKIIVNKDTRVALDPKGKTLFIYGFYDSSTIVYAKNEEVLRSVYDMLLRRNL